MENIEYTFLEEDDLIPRQNWACMSFADPQRSTVDKRRRFEAAHFIQSLLRDDKVGELRLAELAVTVGGMKTRQEKLKEIMDRLETYVLNDETDDLTPQGVALSQEYKELYGEETTIRGLKIRGVFNSLEEARQRASDLQKKDQDFHVFVGEVGKWLPFNAENLQNIESVYMDEQLNTLIKENKDARRINDVKFQDRKATAKKGGAEKDNKRKVQIRDKVSIQRRLRSKAKEKVTISKLKEALKNGRT